jgi:hypothetical protein
LIAITKEAWNTAENTKDKRERIQALSLAKECYSMKLDLLTNATVVDDAIRFVSKFKDREQLKGCSSDSSGKGDNKEYEEFNYLDAKSSKVAEEDQKQETEEITTNQVF